MARSPVYEKGNFWLGLCKAIMYPAAFLFGRQRVEGRENLVRTGGYLVVANHVSHLDPLYDAVLVRKAGRVPRFLAKSSLWRLPVLGRILRGTGQIPVDRGGSGAGQASLEVATDALRRGRVVVIYPEGTVTRDPDRWPMRPRPGVASLALNGEFPVIPVAHWGTQDVYTSYEPGWRFKPLPRKDIHLRVGEPIDLDDLRSRPVDARTIRDATILIMTAVRDLLGEVRGLQPPGEFYDPKRAAGGPAGTAAAKPTEPGTAASGPTGAGGTGGAPDRPSS